MNTLIVHEIKEKRKLNRHLFGSDSRFSNDRLPNIIKKQNRLNDRKNRCSHEIQKDDQMSKNEIYKNKYSKKNAAKKQTINRLTFEKSKRIFGVFYIFTLTNIKRVFFSLNRVPKSRGKGAKIQGIEANSSPNPLKTVNFIKIISAWFESKIIKNSKISRFNCLQKGTKIQGMSVSEPEKRHLGTNFQGKGTKIQGMRLNEAEIWAKGTKKSGKGVVFRDIKNIRGTTIGGALIGVGNYG